MFDSRRKSKTCSKINTLFEFEKW